MPKPSSVARLPGKDADNRNSADKMQQVSLYAKVEEYINAKALAWRARFSMKVDG
jgi:hypothetical protein